jgi:hypothetical protein
MLDWKRVLSRRVFYWIGKVEKVLFKKTRFGPDLMFFIKKHYQPTKLKNRQFWFVCN